MFAPYRLESFLRRLVFRITIAPFFAGFGCGSSILRPRGIEGIGRIVIGNRVYVADAALLAAVPHTGHEDCLLRIGDGCKLGSNNHIYATRSIIFEADVLTANNVYVSDNSHGFQDTRRAIMHQAVEQLRPVRIGQGSWLGQNACVIGASIGKGCVVGANAVVLNDVPDYSVVVGAPARIVRRFDPDSGCWVRPALNDVGLSATVVQNHEDG